MPKMSQNLPNNCCALQKVTVNHWFAKTHAVWFQKIKATEFCKYSWQLYLYLSLMFVFFKSSPERSFWKKLLSNQAGRRPKKHPESNLSSPGQLRTTKKGHLKLLFITMRKKKLVGNYFDPHCFHRKESMSSLHHFPAIVSSFLVDNSKVLGELVGSASPLGSRWSFWTCQADWLVDIGAKILFSRSDISIFKHQVHTQTVKLPSSWWPTIP